MKKARKRLLAIVMTVVMLLLEAPLGVATQLSALKNMGNLSLIAHASSYMNHNVSYNPVTNNYDSGGFPSGLNYCYENETIYFNFSVGTDVFVRKATYHLSRNGKANYLTGDYTPERDYFRYCNFELSLPDGSYSIYWDVQYSAPNYNDPVGSYSTDSYTFTVYDPEIIPSKSTVNLNIDGTKTATIYMTCHGGGSGNYINYTSSTSYCTVSSGNWDNDRMSFSITATAVGSSTLNFNLRTSSGTTVATTSVTVNVTENTYTLSYNANGGSGAPGNQTGAKSYTISSTVPTYFGKTFLGWSKSSSATSASYVPKDTISLTANTPLYAVWKSAESLSLGTNKSVTISFAKQERYYTFKPSSSGTYSFESTGSLDTKAVLYSSSGSELKSDDDGSENGNNFKLDYSLSSGTTYYLKVSAYQSNTGTSTIAVKYIDSTAPTGAINNATNNVAASQTVTLSMNDNVGVAGYYWGTSSTYTNNTYTSTSASSATKTVSSPGTYYLTVKDTSGNVSTNYSITFYKTTLNPNNGSVSPTSVLTKSGNTFTFPTPTRSGYNYAGWSTSSSATSGAFSLKPTSNSTYYAVWTIDDKIAPTGSISSTNNVASSQTVTINLSDNAGIAGYYWGTSSTYTSNTYTTTASTSITKTITSSGTYYLTVKDTSGNVSSNYNITFYKTTLNANGGSVSPTSVLTKSGNTFTFPTPTNSGNTYEGWSTSSSATSGVKTLTPTSNSTYYAVWTPIDSTPPTGSISSTNNVAASQTVTLSMRDNVGVAGYYWGTSSTYTNNTYTTTSASSATKTVSSSGTYYLTVKDNSGNVSSNYSITFYKTSLNANGGSVSPTSVLTKSGNTFTFPTPTKSGNTYAGWSTSSSATTGITTLKPTSNSTYYAVWITINIYNLGEETYRFDNYGDEDSPFGHCFGMAVTSEGYYNNNLDVTKIGIDDCRKLNTVSLTRSVKEPICYYQRRQGSYAERSIVAGGSYSLNDYRINRCNIANDWSALINYVSNNNYNNIGSLMLTYWGYYWYFDGLTQTRGFGGHAVDFLYYKEVNGQKRIYVYDNNFPSVETYFYMDSYGKVHQAPYQTFDISVDSMAIHSITKYFSLVGSFNSTHVIYAYDGEISIQNANEYPLTGITKDRILYMYEIPDSVSQVTITPLVDNADFAYLDENYSFNAVNTDTYGVLKLSSTNAGTSHEAEFVIKNEPVNKISIKDFKSSRTEDYRTTITFSALADGASSGTAIHWYVNGSDRGVGNTYTVAEAKSSFTIQAKLLGQNGDVLAESEIETVTIKSSFFARLKAFFRALFGRLPKVVQEYLGIEIIDRLDP